MFYSKMEWFNNIHLTLDTYFFKKQTNEKNNISLIGQLTKPSRVDWNCSTVRILNPAEINTLGNWNRSSP